MKSFKVIAITHKNFDLSELGKFHIDELNQKELLSNLKSTLGLDELMYLSTCNRVEFFIKSQEDFSFSFFKKFFEYFIPDCNDDETYQLITKTDVYHGILAAEHVLKVASSIESMVVGEREIITQVRNAFEKCRQNGLTGDFIRLLIRHTVETAKRVYTETNISTRPVSIVSLSFHGLKQLQMPLDSRVVFVGAGMTNRNMLRFVQKYGFTNIKIFNRTKENAVQLAKDFGAEGYGLEELSKLKDGFDILISCTGSEGAIVNADLYDRMLNGETDRKVIIDLAIPNDIASEVVEHNKVEYICVEKLRVISERNLKERAKEIASVEEIISSALEEFIDRHRERAVEIAMREVPEMVKDIKNRAMTDVFANELQSIDDESREVLEKVISYMEKKYISMPMIMAKEIMSKHKP
ncbi:MAG: glutamyl-tRNA reductase [Crocinitomicaceae bacterium]|nr:glutamyl-tRNA reductase [Crocinitomicaceae bacterium]